MAASEASELLALEVLHWGAGWRRPGEPQVWEHGLEGPLGDRDREGLQTAPPGRRRAGRAVVKEWAGNRCLS